MNTLKNTFAALILVVTANVFAQTPEVEFDTYSESKQNASKYLLADDVAMRDCPSTYCEKLTTIRIGTNVRLLEKTEESQELNGITSRWYKVKMGPQEGWIWGGLISQKTFVSQANAEVRFVFGEAGYNSDDEKQYQLRAVKNGVELDKMIIASNALHYANVQNIGNEGIEGIDDIIVLSTITESCDVASESLYVVWKDNTLQKTKNLVATAETLSAEDTCYLFYSEIKE